MWKELHQRSLQIYPGSYKSGDIVLSVCSPVYTCTRVPGGTLYHVCRLQAYHSASCITVSLSQNDTAILNRRWALIKKGPAAGPFCARKWVFLEPFYGWFEKIKRGISVIIVILKARSIRNVKKGQPEINLNYPIKTSRQDNFRTTFCRIWRNWLLEDMKLYKLYLPN